MRKAGAAVDLQVLIDSILACRVKAFDAARNRLLVHTSLDGHTLLWLEQKIRDATGNREIEILCEAIPDKNTLRRLKEMRGVTVQEVAAELAPVLKRLADK